MLSLYTNSPMHKHNACDVISDVTIICFLFWQEKHCTCTGGAALAHLHIHQHPQRPILVFPTAMHRPYLQFHITNFKPVTLSLKYFGVPSYQNLKFIRNRLKLLCTQKWQG